VITTKGTKDTKKSRDLAGSIGQREVLGGPIMSVVEVSMPFEMRKDQVITTKRTKDRKKSGDFPDSLGELGVLGGSILLVSSAL
jgi:hypothetical protein